MTRNLPELPDSPRDRAVLQRRAQRLACERDRQDARPQGELFLAVRAGERERYGLPYRWLDEIVRPRGLTPVPGTPSWVAGVMARGGRLVNVLHLAPLLGVEPLAETNEVRVVLVRAAGFGVGLLVDEVIGNERYDAASLAPLPAADEARPWLIGIHAGQLAMLNLETLLGNLKIEDSP